MNVTSHQLWSAVSGPHLLTGAVAAGAALGALGPGLRRHGWLAAGVALCAVAATRPLVSFAGVAALLASLSLVAAAGRVHGPPPLTPQAGGALPCVVEQVPVRARTGWRYLVSVDEGAPLRSGTVLLARQEHGEPPQVGRRVVVDGGLGPASGPDAPGWWRAYLERQGVAATVRVRDITVVGWRGGWRGVRDAVARRLRAAIDRRVGGDDAAVVTGVVLGFDERLSEEGREAFRVSGTAHLLAVSGQNVALVGVAVVWALTSAGVSRWAVLWAAAASVLFYAALCQPGASVVRAAAVGLLALVAYGAGRPALSVHMTLLAFAGIVLWSPLTIGDPGFILSFSAVAGILALGGPLTSALTRVMAGPLAAGVAVSAAATLATAPASALIFGRVSVVGVVINLAAVPVAGVVLVAGLVGAVAGMVWSPLGAPALAVAAGGAHVLVWLAQAGAAVPFATVPAPIALGLMALGAGAWVVVRVRSGRGLVRRIAARLRDLR